MTLEGLDESPSDQLIIKFSRLAVPVCLPWIEVADGDFVPDASDSRKLVFLIRKKDPGPEAVDAPEGMVRSVLEKPALAAYLQDRLGGAARYGQVEDFVIQPANRSLTPEVRKFLVSYNAL
jgi:hypothetical protein